MNIENFNPIRYLESKEIEYKTSGKNVTKNWIEIKLIILPPSCKTNGRLTNAIATQIIKPNKKYIILLLC